jgi:phosphoribosyl-ATP pyrophosphohydrolase
MSDNETTVGELKAVVNRFIDEREWWQYHTAKDFHGYLDRGCRGKEHFIYKSQEEADELFSGTKRVEIEDEVADVLWATLALASKHGIALSSALNENLAKTAKRYPIGARGSNKKYTEL